MNVHLLVNELFVYALSPKSVCQCSGALTQHFMSVHNVL